MSLARLQERVCRVRILGTGMLRGYLLKFHKKGMDGSAKCDAFYTGNPDHYVLGRVFAINEQQKILLDRVEGLGKGYCEKMVEILPVCSLSAPVQGRQKASIYYATDIDESLKPFSWYKNHVLQGGREAGFDCDYMRLIEQTAAIEDPDLSREAQQTAVYRR